MKQKGKKDKNKDKEKEKLSYTSNPLVKKEFSSTSKNIQLKEEKDLEKNDSGVLKKLGRSNSLMLGISNLNKEKTTKKIFGNSNNCLREIKIKKKINKKTIDFDNALEKNKKKLQFNLFSKDKFTNTEVTNSDYLKYTLNCMDLILDIDIKKQTRLKNKVNLNFKKSKKKNKKKKIALFDLDETLVHCTGDIRVTKEKYQNVIQVTLPGKQTIQVGINVRPYWKQTLNLIKKKYYIVIYTASHHAYADAVLDFMDPKKKYFKYRLYRNNCSLIDVEGAQFYVKDLDIFNEYYDLKDIVIVDNSVLSFAYHLHNGIPIVPYYDEDKDGSLYVVGLYLIHIYGEEDLREANKKSINLDSFLEEAKKRKEEEDDIFLEEEDESCDEETQADNKIKKNDENKNKNKIIENKNDIKSIMNIKNIRNSIKKFSEKKVSFNLKKKLSVSQISTKIQRKQSYFFDSESENDKLKNKSKLFKMYDVVKDDSPKSEHYFNNNESFNSTKNNNEKRIKNNNNIIIEEKNENIDEHKLSNGEIDCKSDQAFEQNMSDADDDKEEPVLVRGLTLREDLMQECKAKNNKEKNEKNENNGKNGKNLNKLGFIRSNFYNNFKI
jgi:Dullard-like phosphatase family protein